jgi:stage II sporulation protein AA (anti-sigma F factor antagonist)
VKLDFKSDKDKLYVKIEGELDLLVAANFRTELDQKLDAAQARHLILDFSRVTFIDSSGLGVILGRYKRLAEIGGTVQIWGVNEQIGRILELSGLNRIMEIKQQEQKMQNGTSF